MLMVEWFFTLFTRQFDIITATRIWDKLLVKGEVFLYRLVIWIVHNGFKEVKYSQLDEIIDILRKFCLRQNSDFLEEIRDESLPLPLYLKLVNEFVHNS